MHSSLESPDHQECIDLSTQFERHDSFKHYFPLLWPALLVAKFKFSLEFVRQKCSILRPRIVSLFVHSLALSHVWPEFLLDPFLGNNPPPEVVDRGLPEFQYSARKHERSRSSLQYVNSASGLPERRILIRIETCENVIIDRMSVWRSGQLVSPLRRRP
jgi:hypothetical protein